MVVSEVGIIVVVEDVVVVMIGVVVDGLNIEVGCCREEMTRWVVEIGWVVVGGLGDG